MPSPADSSPRAWRVSLLAALLAVWLGGLVFYATLVIPTGADILGSHTAFGFITRRVTFKLNLLGAGVLAVLLVALFRRRPGDPRRGRAITWGIMAACQLALFALHPWLEVLLDVPGRRIVDQEAFYLRHQVYLWTTMVQWFAGALHFHLLLVRAR